MQITKTTLEDVIILSVEGRLDATTAAPFESAIQAELQAGAMRLVVDLAEVQLISSAALRVLVSAAKQMKKQEGQILLCAMTPEVAKVFGISGLASLFNLQPSRAGALDALGVSAPAIARPPIEPPADVPTLEPLAERTLPPPPPPITPPPLARTLPPPPVRLPQPSKLAAPAPTPIRPPALIFAAAAAVIFLIVLLAIGAVAVSHKRGQAAGKPRAPVSTPARETVRDNAPIVEVAPTPALVPAEATQTPAPPASPADTESVQPANTLNFDQRGAENQETRRAVLQRIAAMSMAPAQRDRLSEAVDHARGMAKIITIHFAAGHTEIGPAAVGQLKEALQRSDIKNVLNDPSAVFIVLGFADSKGSPQVNKDTSQRRADRTLAALRGACGLVNVMHALGMGGSEIVDQEHLEKNRAVEVWAVQP